ncbi:hypothetical protein SARC_01685 [Sphaeroforma arctica JP610]|uniref:Uncharacterized protein n=1 Tax=Sphaeroforma arctica JP610 TaxID=667725 RepID=A0A0L0GB85_9EUKA|nr:hypothetical protein SARC_01685 [Sphaeroforma arctica JP610]KNC86159.1 hypothetical protein SARC_01685 [Sphaeroforma arctica JP610]|eukprot:XP_014160061.1 hypothetical protein SARC_01685 [Sphaeroforma arctica JP610]
MVKSSRRLCCSRNTLMVVVVFILVTLHAYKTSRQQANPSTFSYNNEENTGDLGFADMLSKTESSVKDWFAAKDITDVRGELNSAIEDLSMGALKYPDQVNGKQDDSIAVRNIRDDDGSNTDGVVFENNNLDQWRKRNEDYEGQNQLIEEQSYHQVEGQSTVEKYIRTPPRPPKCAELGLKSKVKQKDVAKTLMGVCPVFHKQLEFHKGEQL